MTTYIAWDGNEYPLPTPEGWYLASDDRWWPEGHGPGPAAPPAAAAPPPPAAAPPPAAVAPPPGMPSAPPPMGAAAASPPMGAPDTVYSAPPPGSGSFSPDAFAADGDGGESSGNGKRFLILGVVLVGLIAIGAGAFFALSSGDDDDAAPATTVAPTQLDDTETSVEGSDTTVIEGGEEEGEATETTAPVAGGLGSLDDPLAIGETIELRYEDFETEEERVWNIVVLEPLRNITDEVAAENQFNEPPPADAQFMGAPVRVTYVSGPEPATLFELSFKAVGPSGVVVATFDPSCGVVPNSLDTFAELFQGGSVEGNLCWTVTTEDQQDLTMIVEVFFSDETAYADLTG